MKLYEILKNSVKKIFSVIRASLIFAIFLILFGYYIAPSLLGKIDVLKRIMISKLSEKLPIESLDYNADFKTAARYYFENFRIVVMTEKNYFLKILKTEIIFPPEAIFATGLRLTKKNFNVVKVNVKNLEFYAPHFKILNGRVDSVVFLPKKIFQNGVILKESSIFTYFRAKNIKYMDYDLFFIKGILSKKRDSIVLKMNCSLFEGKYVVMMLGTMENCDIYVLGRNVRIDKIISEKMFATSFFRMYMKIKLLNGKIAYMDADFLPEREGVMKKFDFFNTNLLRQKKLEPIRKAVETLKNYKYDDGYIKFLLKNNTFKIDIMFSGRNNKYIPHLIVPIHTDGDWRNFKNTRILPDFFDKIISIIDNIEKNYVRRQKRS